MGADLNTGLTPLAPLPTFTGSANPQTSLETYTRFRDLGMELIDTNSPQIFYRVYHNDDGSANGEGVHEKFIYQGFAVLDVSMGLLDFPWYAADGNPMNEITRDQITLLANTELNPLIAWRLRVAANFAATLMPHVRYFHYTGADGVRSLTISDEFNGVKMNVILSHTEEVFPATVPQALAPVFG
jgi:hypothetical protein